MMFEILQKYLPEIVNFIGKDNKLQTKLDDFKVRYLNLIEKLRVEGDSNIKRPHSIIEWLVSAESGHEQPKAFLEYLDNACKFCRAEIDPRLHNKLKSIAWSLVTAFDTDLTLKDNPRYQTFIGELLTVYNILNKKDAVRLDGIEVSLPNGKTADIAITLLESNTQILFDIVSINDFDPTKPKNEGEVVSFFEYRFNQKLEAKTNGLAESPSGTHVLIDGNEVEFKIYPIIWHELHELSVWADTLKTLQGKYYNVLPLSILYSFLGIDGRIAFSLEKVSEAFKAHDNSKAD
jgi:hypothetical protein